MSDGKCDTCQKKFILTSDFSRCIPGIEEAGEFCEIAKYSTAPKCKICNYGYYLSSNGICLPCSVSGCAICSLDESTSNTCKLCLSGYYMNPEYKCIQINQNTGGDGGNGGNGGDILKIFFMQTILLIFILFNEMN
jgi:hypothetical protein